MKNSFQKISIALGIGLFIAACAGSKVTTSTEPTQADVDRNKVVFSNLTLDELVQGKAHYEKSCGSCHKLYSPTSESAVGWKKIVPPMAKKAKVDAKTEDLILKYVISLSSKK